jgi:hypothetical protein
MDTKSKTQPNHSEIKEVLEDYRFFPITGLQVGKWSSAFHCEKQLFVYKASADVLVFLALHSEDNSSASLSYFLAYTRKELLKICTNSPFIAPVPRKNSQDTKGTLLKRLSAEFGGIVAFEVNLKNIEGLDYSNTLNSYGSRITLEVVKGKKLWFSNPIEFCKHYNIVQSEISNKYYTPVLNESNTCFITKQIYPGCSAYRNKHSHQKSECYDNNFINNTPENKKQRLLPKRSLSNVSIETVINDLENSSPFESNFHSTHFNHFTLVAYFDDPIFPFFVKSILKKPKNKYLLTMYERGIPSWAQFLPSYGLPYRPWMRRVMAVIIFMFSLTTMLLGFYDLNKSMPEFAEKVTSVLKTIYLLFETIVLSHLSIIFLYFLKIINHFTGHISNFISFSPISQYLIEYCNSQINNLLVLISESIGPLKILIQIGVFTTGLLGTIVSEMLYTLLPLLNLKGAFLIFFNITFEIIYFAIKCVMVFGQEIRDLFILSLSLPFDIIYGLTYGLCDVIFEFFTDFYWFFSSIIKAFKYISIVFKSSKNKISVAQSLSICEMIQNFWYNIFRHVLRGITGIYNFTVYTSCNIYKHKDSMIISVEIYSQRFAESIRPKLYRIRAWVMLYIAILLCLKIKYY